MRTKSLSLPLLALAAAGITACGSSSSSHKLSGIVLAPSSGATAPPATPVTTTPTTTTPTTPTTAVATPKPPSPLSKEPVIAAQKGKPPTKLVAKDLIKGTGAVAKSGSSVTVNYVGALYNGKVFDASWKRNQTFPFTLGQGQVIPGWDQGIPGMRVGGRRELIIPPSLGYKSAAQPGIPANSTLVFVVDLLAVS